MIKIAVCRALVLLVFPVGAQAAERVEPLTYSSLTPADSASFYQYSEDIRFTIVDPNRKPCVDGILTDCQEGPLYIHIARSPATESDGQTLADTEGVESFILGGAGTYTAISALPTFPPGMYYWQIEAETQTTSIGYHYLTPIFSIIIKPLPQPIPTPEPPPVPIYTPPPNPETSLSRTHCTHARIGGRIKCLRAGEFCAWRFRRQYIRYHYACVHKGRDFRLVRR
jgi:hypothetical protein